MRVAEIQICPLESECEYFRVDIPVSHMNKGTFRNIK